MEIYSIFASAMTEAIRETIRIWVDFVDAVCTAIRCAMPGVEKAIAMIREAITADALGKAEMLRQEREQWPANRLRHQQRTKMVLLQARATQAHQRPVARQRARDKI